MKESTPYACLNKSGFIFFYCYMYILCHAIVLSFAAKIKKIFILN